MSLYLWDSDHLSLYQRGHEPLRSHLLRISPEQVAITIVSVEELVRGRLAQVRKATKPEDRVRAYRWLSETMRFLCDFTVVDYAGPAETYFQQLREQKLKIGTQDLKIGSIALSQNATVVTRNRRDFGQIPHLKIEDWSTLSI
ncbi:MAG: type II toxin-antitoxin system VapC family toxin [Caldilineaceae bacterium]|nr:type II toxin-antitoxin system VapC family toxin [Caldilineaceae bacterium]